MQSVLLQAMLPAILGNHIFAASSHAVLWKFPQSEQVLSLIHISSLENSENPQCKTTSLYASLGTGLLTEGCSPILYEGINEKGLMGGQLYYRGFAHFEDQVRPGTLPLQPPFLVYHMLSQCSSVNEVVTMLQNNLTLLNIPLFGTVPTLHWSFSDRSGESIVIEPDKTGISIYRNTIGVMTNSPGYSWHRLNLLNYAGIRDLDYDTLEIECDHLEQCFSGNGAQGLPGLSLIHISSESCCSVLFTKSRWNPQKAPILFRVLLRYSSLYGVNVIIHFLTFLS